MAGPLQGQQSIGIPPANDTNYKTGYQDLGASYSGLGNQVDPTQLVMPNSKAYVDPNSTDIQNQIAASANMANIPGHAQASNVNMSPLMLLHGAQISTGADQQNAAAQQAAINNLNQIAQGKGPSVAAEQAKQAGQQNLAQQMAAIASSGGNPALAAQRAQQIAGQNAGQVTQAAVQGRTAEQLAAQQTLQSALGQTRQQGQVLPTTQAQLNQQVGLQSGAQHQQTALTNEQNLIATTGMNAQQHNAMLGAGMEQTSYDVAQNEAFQQAQQQAQQAYASLAVGQGIASDQMQAQIMGSAIGAGGTLGGAGISALAAAPAAASDRRVKTSIKSANRNVFTFLDSMKPQRTARTPNLTEMRHG